MTQSASLAREVEVDRTARRPIQAGRRLSAAPDVVLMFLADLDNHALLAPRSVRVLSHDTQDGTTTRALVRLRGPLGIHRTGSTELLRMTNSSIIGRAQIRDTTVASVAWRVQSLDDGSFVTLCATVDAARPFDALLLRFGARRWLARQFASALERLSQELSTS
jgi:Polyketide cyclase / dehydrase and lipid transport